MERPFCSHTNDSRIRQAVSKFGPHINNSRIRLAVSKFGQFGQFGQFFGHSQTPIIVPSVFVMDDPYFIVVTRSAQRVSKRVEVEVPVFRDPLEYSLLQTFGDGDYSTYEGRLPITNASTYTNGWFHGIRITRERMDHGLPRFRYVCNRNTYIHGL